MNSPTPLERIFFAALETGSPEERAGYLDEACAADPDLRRRVEKMLAAQAKAGSFLEQPAPGTGAAVAAPITEQPGTMIGPYKLLEQIGEGGFGVVFMAEQQEPIQRKVALKVLKPGMDTRQVVARFEAERQALALMDHPNIARVLDAGETASGRPYFVMELVRGIPITEFCDRERLTPRERLQLFVTVCQAVQHAHQKGIIHRDLKPSNVMVTLHDGTPMVKVIDFGVAKAMGQKLTDKTLFTSFAHMIGTPLYMSPEQAAHSALDVDTRSDIYSLGVLLYELLTGTTPFDRERFRAAAYEEICRIIREEEPPKPSTRLKKDEGGRMKDETKSTRPTGWRARLPFSSFIVHPSSFEELDWIVMKALEKDRNRRYESANGLARDLERYLQDEAVQACPPSAGYRLRKFVRRYKVPVLAVSLVVLALVGGIIGTMLGLVEARRQRDAAEAAAERAARAQVRAEQGFAKAKEAVEKYLKAVTEDPDLKEKHDLNALRKKLLEAAVPFYLWFVQQNPEDADWEAERGRAFGRLADVRDEMGDKEAAVEEYERLTTVFAKLAAEVPTVPEYRRELARGHTRAGMLLAQLGRRAAAERTYRRALEIQEQLVGEFPGVPRFRQNLASSFSNMAILQSELGQRTDAEQAYRRALKIDEQLVAELPTDADCRNDLAEALNNLGVLLKDGGQRSAAELAYHRAIEVKQRLTADFPGVTRYRHGLAVSQYNLGNLLLEQKQWSASAAVYGVAIGLLERLVADFPSVPKYRQDLARSHNDLGILFMDQKQWPEAREAFRRATAVQEKLVADFPAVPEYRLDLAGSYVNLGELVRDQGECEASLAWFARGTDLLAALLEQEPRLLTARVFLRNAHFHRARALQRLGRCREAVDAWDRALALNAAPDFEAVLRRCRAESLLGQGELTEAEAECRQAVRLQPDRAEHHHALGDVCARSGRWDQALDSLGKAAELDAGNDRYGCRLAVLQLWAGDVAAYRRTCRDGLQRFGETTQPDVAARIAMTCLLLTDSVTETDPVWALADRAVTGTEAHDRYRYFMVVKALAEHRAGRQAEAVKRLEQVAPNANGGNIDAIAFAILAMAKRALGQSEDARVALQTARRIVTGTLPDSAKARPFAGDWDDWLRCQLLLREAETLLKNRA